MTSSSTRTRFAPSPTGRLHLGNVRTALFNYLFAKNLGGRFLLRSEDTDKERSQEQFLDGLMDDLRWLGMTWDEGPDIGGPEGPYRQSERDDIYSSYLDSLLRDERIYPCWCTSAELAIHRKASMAAGKPPIYDRAWGRFSDKEIDRRRASGQRPALRFRVPDQGSVSFNDLVRGEQEFDVGTIGDFIVQRSDGSPSFFFGNGVDDALMGVSHVLRGEDHLSNTPRQLLLLQALELPIPLYGHLPLLVDSAGAPLSKRKGAAALSELRLEGLLPDAINNYLARLGHAFESGELMSSGQLAGHFSVGKIGKTPARYDPQQLEHWQHLALMNCSHEEIIDWAGDEILGDVPVEIRPRFIELVRPNVKRPAELADWVRRFFDENLGVDGAVEGELQQADPALFRVAVEAVDSGVEDLAGLATAVTGATGLKGRNLYRPIRLALTGVADGPELGPIIGIMPRDIIRQRLLRWCVTGISTDDGEKRA
ncbi:MAG: glutamate--tRNA ligase [Gammaproteobacteria bacterium]